MKRKRAVRLLLFCLLCMAVIGIAAGVRQWRTERLPVSYDRRLLGVAVVSDTGFLEEKERKTARTNPGVCFEGVLLPYDSRGICYLSQNVNSDWRGKLSLTGGEEDGCFLCLKADPYLENKAQAIRENHKFTLYLVEQDCYYELELVVSGAPVLSITRSRQETPEKPSYEEDPDEFVFGVDEYYYGSLELFDCGRENDNYEILQSFVRYYIKGAVTKGLDKKSYSLKLLDYQEESVKIPLLGMRESAVWKLHALATDENKIREMTASQIWQAIDEADASISEPGPGEAYVEVVMDNSYMGLFCLVEPVDEHTLKLGENDVLYKVIGQEIPEDEAIQTSIDNGWNIQSPVRIRYPKEIEDYALAWYPMRNWLDVFYRGEHVDYEETLPKLSLPNLADASIFLMVTSASDNNFKNSYYAAKVSRPGVYRMYWLPWDLDFTFGNICATDEPDISIFNDNIRVDYTGLEIRTLSEGNPEGIGTYVWERWKKYRETFLSTESVLKLMEQNRDYLVETGAMEREKERWPGYGITEDIDYLLEYQRERMEWLDEYFEGWSQIP